MKWNQVYVIEWKYVSLYPRQKTLWSFSKKLFQRPTIFTFWDPNLRQYSNLLDAAYCDKNCMHKDTLFGMFSLVIFCMFFSGKYFP